MKQLRRMFDPQRLVATLVMLVPSRSHSRSLSLSLGRELYAKELYARLCTVVLSVPYNVHRHHTTPHHLLSQGCLVLTLVFALWVCVCVCVCTRLSPMLIAARSAHSLLVATSRPPASSSSVSRLRLFSLSLPLLLPLALIAELMHCVCAAADHVARVHLLHRADARDGLVLPLVHPVRAVRSSAPPLHTRTVQSTRTYRHVHTTYTYSYSLSLPLRILQRGHHERFQKRDRLNQRSQLRYRRSQYTECKATQHLIHLLATSRAPMHVTLLIVQLTSTPLLRLRLCLILTQPHVLTIYFVVFHIVSQFLTQISISLPIHCVTHK